VYKQHTEKPERWFKQEAIEKLTSFGEIGHPMRIQGPLLESSKI